MARQSVNITTNEEETPQQEKEFRVTYPRDEQSNGKYEIEITKELSS